MAKLNTTFTAECDVAEFSLTAFNADIEIVGSDGAFTAEFPDGAFTAEERKNKIYIRRKKSLARTWLKISVPESCVPDVKAAVKKCAVSVNSGIFGTLSFYGEGSKLLSDGAAFNTIFTKGSELTAEYASTTTKTALISDVKSGDLICRGSFFSRMDIRHNSGNVGLLETDFTTSEIQVKNGNIQALLEGSGGGYKMMLTAKNGVCNRESGGDGAKALRFTTSRGNIFVDFSKKQKENGDENDNVAENSRG